MKTTAIAPEAVAATTELYRLIALRFARKLSKADGEFDATTYLDELRPYTEAEAQADADTMTAEFTRAITARREDGCTDTYLSLGCDLIEALV